MSDYHQKRCVFEIFSSIGANAAAIDSLKQSYSFYTTIDQDGSLSAVGITCSLVAMDQDARSKANRERCFPIALLNEGIQFQCKEGEVLPLSSISSVLIVTLPMF